MINIEPANLNEVDKIANGDIDFKKELISIFISQIPLFMENMNHFFETQDLVSLAREAHTAKSSVLVFGMIETGKMLKEIQLQAEKNNDESLPDLLSKVIRNLTSAKNQLTRLLNQP